MSQTKLISLDNLTRYDGKIKQLITTVTPASATPESVASAGSVGTSTKYAREDHTHAISVATGDANGQVKIAGQNASVKGFSDKQDKFERISYADWQLLTPQQQAAKPYYIYDYPSSAITAGNVAYDNTSSGMTADDVQEAVDELKSGLTSVINHNKIIYMNDSFGENVTPNISTLVPSQMGWTSADYYGIVKGGSGFGSSAPYNYLTLLQNNASSIASHFDDVDEVSDVIVTGGTNDSYYGDSDTVIKNGISEFANYVNQTYPNAKITIIFTGWADSSGVVTNLTFSNIKRAIVDYEYICQLGGRFFDLHNILHQHSLFNGDHIHPTVVAQHMIADAITSLLKGGEYHVVRTLDVNVVPASGVTVTNGPISLRFTQNDNIITARIDRSSGFWHFTTTAIASTPDGELNNILLGTFSDWIIGSNETGENKLITNCVVGFDGGAKVIPVIFTFENGNIYYGLGNYDTTSKSYTVNACGTESVSFSSYNC